MSRFQSRPLNKYFMAYAIPEEDYCAADVVSRLMAEAYGRPISASWITFEFEMKSP